MEILEKIDPKFAFLSTSCVVKFAFMYMNQGIRPPSAKQVGTVSGLQVFPAKSMRGIEVKALECTNKGAKLVGEEIYDRSFMAANQNWEYQTGKNVPVLTTIKTSVEGDYFVLQKDGHPPLKVPKVMDADPAKIKDIFLFGQAGQGQDCGEEAGKWISAVLQKPNCRLLYSPPEGIKKRWCGTHRKMKQDIWRWNTPVPKQDDAVPFHDGFPYLLTSQASLDDLNSKLAKPVSMDRFRSNIEVSGCKAFEEDNWREVWIGENRFINQIPCDRCVLTTVDPETGIKDPDGEPIETLKKYRYIDSRIKPCFGVHLMLETKGGPVKLGDPIYALS